MTQDIAERYEQAQVLMQGIMTRNLVLNDAVFPHWILSDCGMDTGCFWYMRETRDASNKSGVEYRLVDSEAGTNQCAFDHAALAVALGVIVGESIDPQNLPLGNAQINLSPLTVSFQYQGRSWVFDPDKGLHEEQSSSTPAAGLLSPDLRKTAFVRDHNLWVRDETRGEKVAEDVVLTHDGCADNFYGSAPMSSDVQALWSPDSQWLLTHQLDVREVASRHLIQHIPPDGSLRPQLVEHKMAYPGDAQLERYRILTINVCTGEVYPADYEPLTFYCLGEGFFSDEKLAWWSRDSRRAFFVDVVRGANSVRLVEFNVHRGTTRVLFEENSETYIKLSHSIMERPVFEPLPQSDELIWFSERDGWAHLYLYDLNTGQLKYSITQGCWLIRKVLHVDSKRREILVQTAGRDKNISPYYRDISRINIDTGELFPLASANYEYCVYGPEDRPVAARAAYGLDGDSANGVSPSGRYMVTTYSRVDTPPVSVLIDRSGRQMLELETADVSILPEGWRWPKPVKLKSSDGQTDIYGVVYQPPGHSAGQPYPILDFSCGHPQFTWVPQGSFINGPCFDFPYLLGAAFAALGFVVVALEGRGTPYRDRAFQDFSYGCIPAAGYFGDRIDGIRQLATQNPYMDITRVGIVADDGTPGPVHGLLEHPEFYHVGVVICYEDARLGLATFSEQFEGGSKDYLHAEQRVASLNGKLLLIHGMQDNVTPVTAMVRLTDALQKANKDFDMLLLPRDGHDLPAYAIRRSWDYMVEHLLEIQPPKHFKLVTGMDLILQALLEKSG